MPKNFILIFSSLILLLILINSKPLPKINTNPFKKENHKSNSIFKPHSKEYYDTLVKKGIRLDNITQDKEPLDLKIDYKKDKKR